MFTDIKSKLQQPLLVLMLIQFSLVFVLTGELNAMFGRSALCSEGYLFILCDSGFYDLFGYYLSQIIGIFVFLYMLRCSCLKTNNDLILNHTLIYCYFVLTSASILNWTLNLKLKVAANLHNLLDYILLHHSFLPKQLTAQTSMALLALP